MALWTKYSVFRTFGAVCVAGAAGPLLTGVPPSAQAGWQQVHPIADAQGRRLDLLDVQVVSGNRIYAVGRRGTIRRSDDFGRSWVTQTTGITEDLYGITMRGETGVAVGDRGRILRTTNGGQTWIDVTPRRVGGYVLPNRGFRLYRAAHAGPTYIYAVGGLATGYVGAFALRSTDAGVSWTDVTPRTANTLRSIDVWSANIGYAVGGVYPAEWDPNPGFALVCCPGAQGHWREFVAPPAGEPDPGFHWPLHAVAVGNAQTAYIFRDSDGYYSTTTGGRRWTSRGRMHSDCYHFFIWDADFTTASTGLVVGDFGVMLRTDDGAATWRQLRRPTRVSLTAVSMLDGQRAAVVGPGLTALTTSDGGATWQGTATQTTRTLRAVSFANASMGIAVGDGGDILRTGDGGLTWISASTVNIGRGLQFPFNGIDVIDASTAVAVGGAAVVRSADAGDTWSEMDWRVDGVAPPTKVSFLDSQQGLAVAGPSIVGTTDGNRWTHRYTSEDGARFNDLHFVAAGLAVAVGDENAILRSTDGGQSWTPVAVAVAPANLLGVHFADSRVGWAVGVRQSDYYGLILKTTDGGLSWRAQSHPGRVSLRDVFMVTPTTGVIVGGEGSSRGIVLRTTNGISWVEHPSLTGVNYHGVHLLNATSGFVVGSDGRIIKLTM
jgi:photosystem II stability/assembly factor-like uncharacterized protein